MAALVEAGTPLQPDSPVAGKREKPVAILFADVEGCTRLCERLSPGDMNALIETYFSRFFDAVEVAGGTVNEIMGDGFMALFEAPELDRSVRAAVSAAVSAARRMRAEARELSRRHARGLEPVLVNIGIHAGSAFVGYTRFRTSRTERWTYTASGPVANIAARLCALASGGSILVSAEAAKHLEASAVLEPLGLQSLKNVSCPVAVFRLGSANTTVGSSESRRG